MEDKQDLQETEAETGLPEAPAKGAQPEPQAGAEREAGEAAGPERTRQEQKEQKEQKEQEAEAKREQKRAVQQQKNREAKEKMDQRIQRRRERMQRPLALSMSRLLFVIILMMTVGFGLLEAGRLGDPNHALKASKVFLSLLLGSLVPGVPFLAIGGAQLYLNARRKKEHSDKQLAGNTEKWYRVSALIVLAIFAVLLLAWLVALLLGH